MRAGMKLTICITVFAAAAGSALVVNAQGPAKPNVVQVSASTTPAPAESRRAAATNAQVATTPAGAPESPRAAGAEVLISREAYSYPGAGRRDPFVSLMNTEELRPLLTDLKLVAIGFDPAGRNSVAVLRDMSNKEQYRVKVGQEIGRMRVASIHEKKVVFAIEEFGYSRQETLAMSDSTKVRTQ